MDNKNRSRYYRKCKCKKELTKQQQKKRFLHDVIWFWLFIALQHFPSSLPVGLRFIDEIWSPTFKSVFYDDSIFEFQITLPFGARVRNDRIQKQFHSLQGVEQHLWDVVVPGPVACIDDHFFAKSFEQKRFCNSII